MHASAADPIDTRQIDFLSYGPPLGTRRPGMEELRVAVEPDGVEQYAEPAEAAASFRPVFPLRRGKVQRPLLPDDTLRRDRLLDWMASKIRCRIIYIVAEAGFGKTTLVADFARRSRIRTFWYRLDEDDTDGLVFLRYLVASCRSVEPRLLTRTAALLEEPSIEPVNLESALGTFLSEFEHLGDMPSMVVLDDYYLAEHVTSIRSTLERLIARAPNNLAFVFATRRTPDLSVAVLRARSGLAEMGKEELRFEPEETGRFFAQSYHHPLEADVLQDVQARTDGWAASLQLVKTAVEGRTPAQIRAFVRSMSGAEGHLYDYLAQEVVGELAADLRHFLLRAALLDEVETETSAAIAQIPELVARRLIGEAQHLGLLSRSDGAGGSWRPHPLVREFLLARLETEVGTGGVLELHRRAATLFEPISWRLAARHWAAAGEAAEVRRVLSAAVPTIISTGDLGAAEDLMNAFPDPSSNPWYDILRARALISRRNLSEAKELLRRSTGAELGQLDEELTSAHGQCLMNLGHVLSDSSLHAEGFELLIQSRDAELTAIAKAGRSLQASRSDGGIDELCDLLNAAAQISKARGHTRYEGISRLNLAESEMARGRCASAVEAGGTALELIRAKGDSGEIRSARLTLARAMIHLGQTGAGWGLLRGVLDLEPPQVDPEWVCDLIEMECLYGTPSDLAMRLLRQIQSTGSLECAGRLSLATAYLDLRLGKTAQAAATLAKVEQEGSQPGFRSHLLALRLRIAAAQGQALVDWERSCDAAMELAARQQAWLWWQVMSMMRSAVLGHPDFCSHVKSLQPGNQAYLSMMAELVLGRLEGLDDTGMSLVTQEASSRPSRWLSPLRGFLADSQSPPGSVVRAVELLERIGTTDDIALLRHLAKSRKTRVPDAGRSLIRRLAPRAQVEDLGRLSIRIGQRVVPGGDVRKKVLSLLGFLLTRPQFSATREQIIEALWPGLDPLSAANSLNQTAYFLRRVFEPAYQEGTSAGYVVCKGDMIWLDADLVSSRSSDCMKMLADLRREPTPERVTQLAATYTARFGADFLYDDWAGPFRETLHASFLDRIERSIVEDMRIGMFERAIALAQEALMADPDADQIELQLLRLYRITGAHGAAAEQYAHYASVMREQLGIEPPSLETI
jgi:ATP/maltotriose-dependent transcriptional regulator MalT/DNA-binding SARP family transcriptional activator